LTTIRIGIREPRKTSALMLDVDRFEEVAWTGR
jgi:hypothetical protein